MRRTLAAAVVALSTALTAAPAVSATTPTVTAPRAATAGVASADRDATAVKARAALATASDLVTGDAAPSDGVRRVDATLALTDLFARLDHLRGPERTAAEALLARPTDGAATSTETATPCGRRRSAPATSACTGCRPPPTPRPA